ncbi:MAG: primosomal protein N', partial [Campylobacteraceae bacterium]|nr:primosomal protein N' [Campylobacteraceae bacterium]
LISHANEQKAARITEQILAQLKSIENLEIIGHGKASIAYIASKFRYYILLRAYSHSPLLKAGNIALAHGATADIDPFNFN